MERILLTGFEGRDNPSRIITEGVSIPCRKLILPNDKEKSAEQLHKALEDKSIACVVMLGQKSLIKDKIAVEPYARRNGSVLHTPMDVGVCCGLLKESGYDAYISKGAGNSYCSNIYYECLETGVNCVFLHVPSINNISDMKKIIGVVEKFAEGISGIPAIL